MEVENNAGRRVWFSREDDVELMGLVVNENPFKYNERWGLISSVLQERRRKSFVTKTVRQRVNKLISNFREKDRKAQFTSGKEEGWDEMDQLLQEASDIEIEMEINPHLVEKKRKRKLAFEGIAMREEAALNLLVPQDQIETEVVKIDDDVPEPLLAYLKEDCGQCDAASPVLPSPGTCHQPSPIETPLLSPPVLPSPGTSHQPSPIETPLLSPPVLPSPGTSHQPSTISPIETPLISPPGPKRAKKS